MTAAALRAGQGAQRRGTLDVPVQSCGILPDRFDGAGDWGPRRVTQAELRDSFADGWSVARIEPATFEINPLPEAESVDGWLAVFRRH